MNVQKSSRTSTAFVALMTYLCCTAPFALSGCTKPKPPHVTTITIQPHPVTLSQPYVGHIHSQHQVEIRAPAKGQVEAVTVDEGQSVKQNDRLFQVKMLALDNHLDPNSSNLSNQITAPFAGTIGRLSHQQGSSFKQGDTLTTLTDNRIMSADFKLSINDPLANQLTPENQNLKIELVLASGAKYEHAGKLIPHDAHAQTEIGTVQFQAEFPNPEGLLHHNQTGTILLSRTLPGVITVPQQAKFEVDGKTFVYVVEPDGTVHQREITIQHETDNLYVIQSGLFPGDTIVAGGIQNLRDGDKVSY